MAVVARRRSFAVSQIREQVLLLGVKDGVNLTFTTPERFVQTNNVGIRVYFNGVRQRLGVGSDYTVSESGGPGTGYDTVTMAVAPKVSDQLTADYYADL